MLSTCTRGTTSLRRPPAHPPDPAPADGVTRSAAGPWREKAGRALKGASSRADISLVVDGTDNQPTSERQPDEGDRAGASGSGRDKPVSFDFKLRLGSREDTNAQLSGRATGELVQLHAIDWDSLTAPPEEAPRSYKTDGDLQSIIVELANQIAGPDANPNPVVHVTASGTIATSRRAARPEPAARPESARPESARPESAMSDPAAKVATPAEPPTRPPAPAPVMPTLSLAPLRTTPTAPTAPTAPNHHDAIASPLVASPPAASLPAAIDIAVDTLEPGLEMPAETAPEAEPEITPSDDVGTHHGSDDDGALAAAAAAAVAAARAPSVANSPAAPAVDVALVQPHAADPSLPAEAPDNPPVLAGPVAVATSAEASLPLVEPVPVEPMPVAVVAAAATVAPVPPSPAQPTTAQPTPAPVVQFVSGEAAMASSAAPASSVPAAPAPALSLARIERKPNAERPSKPVDFQALLGQAGLQSAAVKRRKKRHPFRVLFKLVVLLGILGAGLYFGKIYVLDKRWDAELKPFAEAVSAERELEWKRAVKVEVLPAEDYATKLTTSWLGITEIELDSTTAEWRAMGLAEGRIEPSIIGSGAMSSRPVFYDPIDAKIYELEDTPDELRELAMDRALTMALLDQHYEWSAGLADLDPSQRTAVRAMFDGDAVSTAMAIVDPSDADSAELVEQVNEIVADHAEDAVGAPRYAVDLVGAAGGVAKLFDGADGVTGRDELLRTKLRSDAGLFDAARGLEYRPEDLGGELTEARGMLYWYYVLAGRLEPGAAWDAVLAWDGDRVVVSQTANGYCVEATIATSDEVGRQRLLSSLQQWAALGPVEAGAKVTEIGTEQLSVFSCDPGPEFDTVASDQIATFGESTVELTVIGDLEARDDAQRACVVNAVRGFDVPAIIATGDQAQIAPALDGIRAACVG